MAVVAPIRPLAWKPPYAADLALKSKKNPKNKKWFKGLPVVGVPMVAQWLTNPTRNHEVESLIPGLAQWVMDPTLW